MTEPTAWSPAPLEPNEQLDAPAHAPASGHGATVVGADATAGRGAPRRKGPWLWPLLGLTLVAVLGVAAWMFFVRPTPGVAADAGIADVTEQPEEAWSYQYATRGEEEWISSSPIIRPLGDDRIVVLSTVGEAYYSAQYDSSWYPGYDEHYAAGYADGVRHQEAFAAYLDDSWSNPYPSTADYFSIDGATYDDYLSSSDGYQGWADGFTDGDNDYPEGTSRAVKPEDPPTMGELAVIEAGSGAEVWTVDLATLDPDTATSTVLRPSTPEGHLVLGSWIATGDDSTLVLRALDPSDGAVVSETELVDAALAETSDAEAPLVVMIDDVVVRLDSADLGGDYLWSASIPGAMPGQPTVTDGLVRLSTEDGDWWLDAATGFEPEWFDGADPDVSYRFVGDVILRLETSSFGSYIDAMNSAGDVLWTGDADRIYTASGSGGDVLLRAEDGADGEAAYLMRLDPTSGEPMWDSEYAGSLDWVRGTVPGSLVLTDDGRSVLVDLDTGERQQRLRGTATYLGTTVAYGAEEGRLRAWDVGDGSELWSMRLSDSEAVTSVGTHLLVHDTERRELALLQ